MFNNGTRTGHYVMPDYLERIGTGFILKNPEVFGFDFVPDVIVGREIEQGDLANIFSGINHPKSVSKAVVTGPVGSGKTALVKTFCRDLKRHLSEKRIIQSVHINCRNANTSSGVVQRIVQELDPGHPDRGLGVNELLTSIRKLIRRNNAHLILTLDEVDHLLRRSGNDLLYKILRIDEDQNEFGTLSLILISQEQVLDFLEGAVISRIGHSNHLKLKPYDKNGLFNIARQRRNQGLNKGTCSEEILDFVAEAAEPSGDARHVIELLEGAAKRAEKDGRKEIILKDIQKTVVSMPTEVEPFQIQQLPMHSMLILLGISRRLKKKKTVTSGEIEKLYHVVCEEYNQSAKGYTTIWKHIKEMANENLINTRTDNVGGGRGRTQHISMPHMLPSDVQKHLERLINKQL